MYTAANGTAFTDDDLERWAQEAEAGFPGATFSPSTPGRPISVGEQAKPFTLRLDTARREKLRTLAEARHTNPSQVMRELIDAA